MTTQTQQNPTEVKADKSWPKVLVYMGRRYAFNPHKIIFGEPSKTSHGSFVVNAQYPITLDSGSTQRVPIILQTPRMRTQFGFSDKKFSGGKASGPGDAKEGGGGEGETRAQCDLTFANKESDPALQEFHEVLEVADEVTLAHAIKNKARWFRDPNISTEILRYLYKGWKRRNIRKTDGRQFFDDIRPRVQKRYNKYECGVFNAEKKPFKEDGSPLTVHDIKRGSTLSSLIEFNGIWFLSTSWSVTFKYLQVRIEQQQNYDSYSFVEDGSSSAPEDTGAMDYTTNANAMVDDNAATTA